MTRHGGTLEFIPVSKSMNVFVVREKGKEREGERKMNRREGGNKG